MKIMPHRKDQYTKPNTGVPAGNDGPISLEDTREHLEQLRCVSAIATKLFALLGEQMTAVALTAPIQKGLIAVWPPLTPVLSCR